MAQLLVILSNSLRRLLALFFCFLICVSCLNNGLIRRPPMGWSTWNLFHCNINETLVKQMTDAMATKMSKFGYQYINLDDCWLDPQRDSDGHLQGDKRTFPTGMKALGDYIHSKGLKFGLYGDPGTKTCAGRPGNEGHEYEDARTYASWGCDYLKYDSCYASHSYQLHAYMDMRDALNQTGRPIGYSICPDASRCNDPNLVMWDASSVANVVMCRGDLVCRKRDTVSLRDIQPTWKSWTCILDVQSMFNSMVYAGPGHFIMPDMLEVGNGMTEAEDRSHFSLWAMIAAPLIAGNDLRNMSQETLNILTNQEVIDVNQDIQGKPGRRVYYNVNDSTEVWIRQLDNGDCAVVLFNRNDTTQSITLKWSYVGLPDDQPAHLRDIWAHKDIGIRLSSYTVAVPTHDVVMLILSQQPGGKYSCSNVHLSDCANGNVTQMWTFSTRDKTIRSVTCGLCLDVYDCQTSKPTNVQLYECHVGQPGCGSYNQEWSLNSNGTITTGIDGRCLTALNDGSDAIETQVCETALSNNQQWSVDVQKGLTSIVSRFASNRCLTVS